MLLEAFIFSLMPRVCFISNIVKNKDNSCDSIPHFLVTGQMCPNFCLVVKQTFDWYSIITPNSFFMTVK